MNRGWWTNRLASAGGIDVFLAKLNHDSDVIWAMSTDGPREDLFTTHCINR
jgi:hypothetical protein